MKNRADLDATGITRIPTFHDAELVNVMHDPDRRMLHLRFRRVDGTHGTFRFSGVIGQRIVDLAGQNVVSRLLISPAYAFSATEVHDWLRWIHSRSDFTAAPVDAARVAGYTAGLTAGRHALFVLEPSCGAEAAVLCGAIHLMLAPHA